MFNKELLMMGNNGGSGGVPTEPPEDLSAYTTENTINYPSVVFFRMFSFAGFLSLWLPTTNQVIIRSRANTMEEISDRLPDGFDPDVVSETFREYSYLIPSILILSARAYSSPPLTFPIKYATFIRDLAENYFKGALLVNPSNTDLFFTPAAYGEEIVDDMRSSIDYFKNNLTVFAGNELTLIWEYSEKVRKGEI